MFAVQVAVVGLPGKLAVATPTSEREDFDWVARREGHSCKSIWRSNFGFWCVKCIDMYRPLWLRAFPLYRHCNSPSTNVMHEVGNLACMAIAKQMVLPTSANYIQLHGLSAPGSRNPDDASGYTLRTAARIPYFIVIPYLICVHAGWVIESSGEFPWAMIAMIAMSKAALRVQQILSSAPLYIFALYMLYIHPSQPTAQSQQQSLTSLHFTDISHTYFTVIVENLSSAVQWRHWGLVPAPWMGQELVTEVPHRSEMSESFYKLGKRGLHIATSSVVVPAWTIEWRCWEDTTALVEFWHTQITSVGCSQEADLWAARLLADFGASKIQISTLLIHLVSHVVICICAWSQWEV